VIVIEEGEIEVISDTPINVRVLNLNVTEENADFAEEVPLGDGMEIGILTVLNSLNTVDPEMVEQVFRYWGSEDTDFEGLPGGGR